MLQVIVGNLSADKLGLSDLDYSAISNKVNLIINSAADIDLKSNYQQIKNINVGGLNELIKLSVTNDNGADVKCIVNFSSYSVFLNQIFNQEFDESTILPSFDTVGQFKVGYIQSKIVAEKLLMETSSLGIPSLLLRLPSLFSNSKTGIGSSNDLFLLMIQSCYSIGYYPNDKNKSLLISPIEWIADKTIKIITNENCCMVPSISDNKKQHQHQPPNLEMNIFNINGNLIASNIFFKYLEDEFNCKGIDFNKWLMAMEKSDANSCIKLRSFHNVKDYVNDNEIFSNLNISKKTKSILESMNSYDNGWFITSKIIKNHINNIFNK